VASAVTCVSGELKSAGNVLTGGQRVCYYMGNSFRVLCGILRKMWNPGQCEFEISLGGIFGIQALGKLRAAPNQALALKPSLPRKTFSSTRGQCLHVERP
jgi:hypothetical protein